jgi:hypothetical protein
MLSAVVAVAALAGSALAVTCGQAGLRADTGLIAYTRSGANGGLYVMKPDGSDQTLVDDLDGLLSDFVWSADGNGLFITEFQEGIGFVDADGSGGRRLVARGRFDEVTPSPDGRKIAFSRSEGPLGDTKTFVYLMNVDGSNIQRLDPGFGRDFCLQPAWSPNSRLIAYVCNGESGFDRALYVMNADGTGQRREQPVQRLRIPRSWHADAEPVRVNWWCIRRRRLITHPADATGSSKGERATGPIHGPVFRNVARTGRSYSARGWTLRERPAGA